MPSTDTKVSQLVINELTKAQFDKAVVDGLIRDNELYLVADGGESGTSDYTKLTNKPSINSVELIGDNTLDSLGIQAKGDYALKSDIPTVPTNVSAFTNDSGYLTEHQSLSGYATESYVQGYHDSTKQDKLTAGANITIDPETNTISATGGSGSSTWGSITGTLSNQTDLNNALNAKATDSTVVHKTGTENITGQKIYKLNNTFANNTLDAIFANGIFIGDGNATTTSRLFNTRWCNNAFQIKTSQDIGYSYLSGSNSTNYGLKYQVQRMPSRSAQPTAAGVVEAAMFISYEGLIVGYSEQANKKVEDNEFIYVLDQKNIKTKTIDTLNTTDKTVIGAINELKSEIGDIEALLSEI